MLKSEKTLRLIAFCFAVAGIALALAMYQWPARAGAAQNPAQTQPRRPVSTQRPSTTPAPPNPNGPAAAIIVSSLADAQGDDGQCTLREALINANANDQSGSTDCVAGSGADTITFSVTGTINLIGPLPIISESLTVNGPGANQLTLRRDTGGDYTVVAINNGTVNLSGLTISNGRVSGPGALGGGIINFGTLTVTNCAITGNQAAFGGGIGSFTSLTVIGSTISGNTAGDGGGLFVQGPSTVNLTNSTISGNTATIFTGGITNISQGGPPSSVTLTNCTVTGNTGVTEGGISTVDNDGISPATTTLKNNIVANNSTPNLAKIGSNANVVSQGNNLASDNGSGLLTGPGDLTNANPQLAPLGNYGGPTQTHLLLAGSQARNAGNNTGAPATDQRGYPRPVGATVDIGSVENDVTLAITPDSPLPPGQLAQPYNQQLMQTGGATGTITWTVISGSLPNNVSLDPSTGLISGTPTANGVFNFTVAVTSQNGLAGVKSYTLAIGCPVISITPGTLTAGAVGAFYSQQLTATGGTPGYTFTVSVNAPPAGLTLSSSGLLSGTPSAEGSTTFTVKVTDSAGCMGTQSYTLIISASSTANLQFYPLAHPVRLLDTRSGASACFTPNMPIAGGTSLTQVARGTCDGLNIPANAAAITGNITTVQSGGGYLTLYPSDAAQPLVANSNYGPNEVINNVFTVGLGIADGAFKIFVQNTTAVVVDVTGYYASPGAGGLYFHPLPSPIRLLDTRPGAAGCFTPGTALPGGMDTTQQATGMCSGIPAAARAIVGNATTVSPVAAGFLTLFPADATRPLVASSNYGANQVVNGPFTVGLSPAGQFKIFPQFTTHLVIDVLGYYSSEATDANGAGLLFTPLSKPVRLLDTRSSAVACIAPGSRLMSNTVYNFTARGVCDGVTTPNTALAIVGNATVVTPDNGGFMTIWPFNTAQPTVATSNFATGQVYNRHFIVGLDATEGKFNVFFNLGGAQFTTDLVIDLSGYFAP